MHRHARKYSAPPRFWVVAGVWWTAWFCCACGGGLAPVMNIESAPVVSATGLPPSRTFVRDAIVRALVSRNWQIELDKPEGITATTVSGSNTATIQIQYDERAFSIHHVASSPSLKYNGSSIHHRYNQWIDHLRVAIRAQLAAPDTSPPAAAGGMPPGPANPAPAPPVAPNEFGEMPPAPPPPPPPGL